MFSRISQRDLTDFAKNFSVMTKTGMPVNESLATLAEQSRSRRLHAMLDAVRKDVITGQSLTESFTKHRKHVGDVFIGLIKAGESSGTLEENLSFLADWLERSSDLHQEVRAATLYPKFVMSAAVVLGGWLTIYILPKLVPFFRELRVELPLPTKLLLGFAVWVETWWFAAIFLIIAAVAGMLFARRLGPVRARIDAISIRIPAIGKLIADYQLSLISQLFWTLFKSGLAISEVISITADAATNMRYRAALAGARSRMAKGTMLADALREYPDLFPKNFVNIVATGEKSGTLDDSFKYLSAFYEKEVRAKTKKLPTVIEPVLLVLIAGAITFIALSIIMPIYKLTSGLGGG
jgi:type IV pilus assembly protein PilC